ncbi:MULTISPECIES: serine hydrolase domain-containing protein [Paenibacillus]|uniref:serine hydrolase domain-containing protein n=1 Tax=Paenibacillus TaxID=44249 RepID=UPI0022B92CAC|nr:serine hydrolase [Paenibacillus caseinilyticus]MCZ8521928.1 serine hydrolase [Paenibacillus caseinilyticus]
MRETNGKGNGSDPDHPVAHSHQDVFAAEHSPFVPGHREDPWPTAGWLAVEPEAQGMDSGVLAGTIEAFRGRGVHSLAVIRGGRLVAEAYDRGTEAEVPQDVRSVTKSIVSALTGAALADGKLKSVEQRAAEFFPVLEGDPVKSQIRIKHLLSMTSGLQWDNAEDRSSVAMMHSDNWIDYILARPAASSPGKVSTYSNGDAHLLSAVLQEAVGAPLSEYARTRLFGPLGIGNFRWNADPQGRSIGAWAMALTARDMAKLGWLFLKEGEWEGKALLPKGWVRESLSKRVVHHYKDGRQGGYGYFWWLKPLASGLLGADKRSYETFYAAGSGGQRIFVVPGLELVVTLTASSADGEMPEELLNGVVRSIRPKSQLPAAPDSACRLTQAIRSFKTEPYKV